MRATGYDEGDGRGERAGQVATVGEAQTNEVLELRLDRLEQSQAHDRREVARTRDESMRKIAEGFAELKADINNLRFVHPEVFTAWQQATEARFDRLEAEEVWNRRLLIGSVGGAIMAFIAWAATGMTGSGVL